MIRSVKISIQRLRIRNAPLCFVSIRTEIVSRIGKLTARNKSTKVIAYFSVFFLFSFLFFSFSFVFCLFTDRARTERHVVRNTRRKRIERTWLFPLCAPSARFASSFSALFAIFLSNSVNSANRANCANRANSGAPAAFVLRCVDSRFS